MFCPECKAELPDDAKFCIRCGYDFTRIKTPPPEQPSDLIGRLRTSPRPEEPIAPSESLEALSKGELFARRYRILSEGRRGGMGVVYKCEDQKLHRTVALKIIHPRLLSSEQAVKRFRQEVSISLELLHRNIVRVYNLDEYEGIEFFTMEWIEGKSLREILNERKKEGRTFTLAEERDDIYSMGKTFYEMLTGKILRNGEPFKEISQVYAGKLKGINELLKKCISPAREDRWQTVGELRSALEHCCLE